MPDKEVWLPAPDFETIYEVSSRGRVRRSAKARKNRRTRLLRLCKKSNGRLVVTLSYNGTQYKSLLVHRLVCRAFHGPPPTDKHEVAHNDGDCGNNAAENLRWATHSENMRDLFVHIAQGNAARRHFSRDEVLAILRADGGTHEIARRFGTSPQQVRYYRSGRSKRYPGGAAGQ